MTVNVKVRLFGVFRGFSGRNQLSLKLEHATVKNVIQTLAESLPAETRRVLIDPELNDPRPNALILVNGREIGALNGLETEVKEDDEIALIPIAHGG